jgi:hypothetical protein
MKTQQIQKYENGTNRISAAHELPSSIQAFVDK